MAHSDFFEIHADENADQFCCSRLVVLALIHIMLCAGDKFELF